MARKDIQTIPARHPLGEPAGPAGKEKAPRTKGGLYTFLLFTFGFVMVATGAAIAYGPRFSELDAFLEKIGPMGLKQGNVIAAGLVVFAMGLLSRRVGVAAAAPRAPVKKENDFSLVAGQIASELGQVKTTMFQLSEEMSGLADSQKDLAQHQAAPAEGAPDSHEALFRLAASLDQLHARIDERVGELGTRFEERMDRVAGTIDSVRLSLETTIQSGFAKDPGHDSPPSGLEVALGRLEEQAPQAPQAAHAPHAHGGGGPELSLVGNETEDMNVVVDLDEGESEQSGEFFDTVRQLKGLVEGGQEEAPAPFPQGQPGQQQGTARRPQSPPTQDLDALWPED